MRVLMTGAGGSIGSRIHPLLRERFELRLVDVRPVEGEPGSAVGDVADFGEVMAMMEGMDAVMHLAIASARDFGGREDDFNEAQLDVNVKGTYNILEAARRLGVRKVALASTVMIGFGYPFGEYIAAGDPPRGEYLYATTKYMNEVLGEMYARMHGMQVICWRIGSPIDVAREPDPSVWWRTRADHERGLLVSYEDLANGFARSVEVEGAGFGVFPLVSDNPDCYMDATEARHAIGYEPVHRFTASGIEVLREGW